MLPQCCSGQTSCSLPARGRGGRLSVSTVTSVAVHWPGGSGCHEEICRGWAVCGLLRFADLKEYPLLQLSQVAGAGKDILERFFDVSMS